MGKLDPGLKYLLTATAMDLSNIAAESAFGVEAEPDRPARINVLVEFRGDVAQLEEAGLRVRTRAENILSGDIDIERVRELENVPGLIRVEASRALTSELNFALPEARVSPVHIGPPGQGGAGVIIGFIDSGIDYQHPAFRNTDGTTRIEAIWDQRLQPLLPGEQSPAGFNFGVEYKMGQINAALASSQPLMLVRHKDRRVPNDGFHGTHVAGIAAGNGRPTSPGATSPAFVGVAPEAGIVVVANTRARAQNERGLGDSADTLDAVKYILNVAAALGRPVVINQSQGDNIGPHDGTGFLEQGISNLLGGPGRVVVKSAGNEGEMSRHAQGELQPGDSRDVLIKVPTSGTTEVAVDIWYSGPDRISVQITPPGGAPSDRVSPPQEASLALSNGNSAFVDADLNDPGNHDNRIFIVLHPGSDSDVEAGVWTLNLKGETISNGKWHAWIQRHSGSKFQPPFANRSSTITVPGTGREVITVGAYVSKGPAPGSLSHFSSRGPTRDGRSGPTLAAPGEVLTAPQPASASGSFGPMFGTSMAAPMVTGTVALMLERNPHATATQVRQCLERTARRDGQTGSTPNDKWGAGKLDAEAACAGIVP